MMRNQFPVIETKNIVLRPIVASDIENIYRGLSHPDVTRYYGVSFDSLEATKEQMQWFSDLKRQGTGIWWAICLKTSQKFIGAIGLNDLNKEKQKAEIGFWLFPEYWRKGIGTTVIPLILKYAFITIGLHIIEAFVCAENVNCKKTLEKLNFNFEGTVQELTPNSKTLVTHEVYSKQRDL